MIKQLIMWASVAFAALMALGGVFLTGKIRGKADADTANAKANAERTVEVNTAANAAKVKTVETAHHVQIEISRLPVGGAAVELFDKYSRPKPTDGRGDRHDL